MTRRWEIVLAAGALALFGLVVLALVFAQPGFYEEIARRNGFAPAVWHSPLDGRESGRGSLADLVALHATWLQYVTGFGSGPRVLLFTVDEARHMADVRRVFVGAEVLAAAAFVALVWLGRRAARRGRVALLLLARDASLVAAAAVALIGGAAAAAFDPLFLLFHELFFPQGNFLFDPATSNLLRIYPDEYWYETTLRIGGAFVLAMAAKAIAATATLRQARR